MQPAFVLFTFFLVRFAIPIAVLLYLGARQERRDGPAF